MANASDTALVDRLAATIQARVLSGEFASGSRLRQESLASEFGVSRTPVREAYEVRAELEGLAAALASARCRDEDLRRLRDAQDLFEESSQRLRDWRQGTSADPPPPRAHADWIRGNDLFHLVIQDAAENQRLRSTLADLHRSFPRDLTWIVLGESSHLLDENVAQHASVLDAIERRDAGAARRRMVAHVLGAGDLVVRRFEERAA